MMNDNLQSKLLELLKPYEPARISIFGSYARGENQVDSDLDVLISLNTRSVF
jgi:hypothetical protein